VPVGGELVVKVVAVPGAVVLDGVVGVVGAIAAGEIADIEHPGHDGHTEPAGEVVVAGARLPHGTGSGVLAQRADWSRRRQLGQDLEEVAHPVVGEPVVAVATVLFNAGQAAVEELAQVIAGGGGGDCCLGGEPARGQRSPVVERQQHPAAPLVCQ